MERKELSQVPIRVRDAYNRAVKSIATGNIDTSIYAMKLVVQEVPGLMIAREKLRELERRRTQQMNIISKVFFQFIGLFYLPLIMAKAGKDPVKDFPPIRVWGTVGFICSMLLCDVAGFQTTYMQFMQCAVLGLILGFYAMTLPSCPVSRSAERKSLVEALGLRAFTLFKQKKMALFFIFSMLLGVSLQITNGFANPFITSFRDIPEYASTFGANHANALISLSQVSETLCILLIPFCLKRFGIKNVMLMAMFAWVLRFGLFGIGNPGSGVWMFILSMIVYCVAFDFFNISGSLFVNKETDVTIRSSAQGLFMIMTNGIGATIGTLGAQAVVNHFVYSKQTPTEMVAGWSQSWLVFAGYALVVAIVFALVFRYRHDPNAIEDVNH